MADMLAGTHMHDPNSEWSQFDFGQNEQPYSLQEPDYQFPTQVPQYSQQSYYDFSQEMHSMSYEVHDRATSHAPLATDYDSMDNYNGSRLTQTQVAELETSFVAGPKPKTDYKKSLAEKLGLELPRVNHWFQNRRQKAKAQKHHGQHESDASSTGVSANTITQTLSLPTSETHISSESTYQEQPLYSNGPVAYDLNLHSADDFSHFLNDPHPQIQSRDGTITSSSHFDPVLAYHHDSNTAPAWMSELTHTSNTESFSTTTLDNQPVLSMSPPSFTGSHAFKTGFESNSKDFVNAPFLQDNVIGHGLLDNNSSQTLNSNASSTCEPTSLMTPPTNTPPLPWLSSEFDPRRTSDSSELAHNVEGMHIQHGQAGLSFVNNVNNSGPASRVTSFTGMATPDTSPEQAPVKTSAPSSDIASRRKRSRPATLRPESNRSISMACPSTLSPHSKQSSMSHAPPTPVRRIQSQGQNLNTQFRVRKPSHNSAQISPRNLQTHFDKHSSIPTQKQSSSDSNHASPTAILTSSKHPWTSAASANKSPAEYQHEFHAFSSTSQWNANSFQMRHANSSVPDLHSTSTQQQHSLSVQVPSQQDLRHPSYHCPPQSAPPQQTTFLDNSPVSHHGPFQPPEWQGHHFNQQSAAPVRSSTPAHQHLPITLSNDAIYLPPFAPHFRFPQDNLLSGLPPGAILGGSSVPAELEIRVDVGPEPKLASKFEKFEFQHTFSDKYGQNGEKK